MNLKGKGMQFTNHSRNQPSIGQDSIDSNGTDKVRVDAVISQ